MSEKKLFLQLRRLIPPTIPSEFLLKEKGFRRKRKLVFPKLVSLVLNITGNGKSSGMQAKITECLKMAHKTNLWRQPDSLDHSCVSRARGKVSWKFFGSLFKKAVDLTYRFWPEKPGDTWKGLNVFAIDSSKYTLPAREALRKEFDACSGLEYRNKGHYPLCMVTTAYDLFRHFPVARTVVKTNSSERDQAKLLMDQLPDHGVVIFDEGYPSIEIMDYLQKHYAGYFLFRNPASGTVNAVMDFIASEKAEDIICILPGKHYQQEMKDKAKLKALKKANIRVRAIRLQAPDGKLSVLLTNLLDTNAYSRQDIIDLYFKRWDIETYYRDEKESLQIETFHSRTVNGVLQELFAVVFLAVIARLLMAYSSNTLGENPPDVGEKKKPHGRPKVTPNLNLRMPS